MTLNSSPKKNQGEKSASRESCFIPWTLVKQEVKTLHISPLKCKCWDCKRCGPKKQEQLKWQARAGRPTKMLTLTTSQADGRTPTEAAQLLRTAWRQLRRKVRRVFHQGKVEFIAIFEKTGSGYPHLHILTRMQYVPQVWISKEMDKLIASPIVDIRRIKNKRAAAAYVSKYIAKAPERFEGCKRFWKSMEYSPKPKMKEQLPPGENNKYYVVRSLCHKVKASLLKSGYIQMLETLPEKLTWWKDRPPPVQPGSLAEIWF